MNEEEARRLFAGQRAEALVRVINHGWDAYTAEQRPRSSRTRANVVWDYMQEAASESIEPMEGVRRIVRHRIPLFVFDGRAVVRFKKHDREMRYANVRTRHQDDIAQQQSIDGLPPENLTAGYLLDRAEAAIEKRVLARHINHKVEWSIDLDELAAGVLEPVRPTLLNPTLVAPKLPTFRPAAKEAEDTE